LNVDLFLDVFVALFALLNPFFTIPVFLGLTGEALPAARQRIAAVAAVSVLVALLVAAIIGDQILELFGIHVASFQIAGGLIVLTIALNMLNSDAPETANGKSSLENVNPPEEHRNIAVYPLAVPLLAGPGVFVTVVVFSSRIDSMHDMGMLGAAILAIVVITWLSMALATTVSRFITQTSIVIGTKILGILLAAVAVEMIITGINAEFFPTLTTSQAHLPYGPLVVAGPQDG